MFDFHVALAWKRWMQTSLTQYVFNTHLIPLGSTGYSRFLQYKINTLGVIHAISAFLPLLRASTATLKKIVVISTQGADPKFWRTVGGANAVSYSITKAATWVATTKYAIKLKDEGFVVVSLCPGAVDTSGTTPGLSAERK